jgi:hypothetical protein
MIGSWGKNTVVRPPRDVDLYFILPPSIYYKFNNYQLNRQSALLQEVKTVLSKKYPDTYIRGDGQVVVVHFDTYAVEVVPAFLLQNGRYWICDTHNGGSYNETDPEKEREYICRVEQTNNNNLRRLICMLKAWQTLLSSN